MKFTPLDLVAPWGICLGSAGLLIWGTITADATVAKVVCGITAAAFLAGIPLWYRIRR